MSPQICRNATVAFEMLLDLIKIFGPVIHSTLSASSLFGVELQAEQRYALQLYSGKGTGCC